MTEWCGNVPPRTPDSGNNNVRVYGYSYDAANNLTGKTRTVTSPASSDAWVYTYDNANQQLSVSMNGGTAETRTYDAWGRMATRTQGTQAATLGWAYQDRLKSYTTNISGETSVNYSYSGDGRRTAADNSNMGLGPKTWSYDTKWGVRSQSYTNQPTYSAWYILEPGGTVLAEAPSSGVVTAMKYYFRDHLGSTRSVRQENTSKFAWFEYEPYGKVYAAGGFLNQLFVQDRFTGHEYDYETNMYWAPYRNYRPDMLRWISRDPLGMVDGPNVYGYVGGRVVRRHDPMGGQFSDPHLNRIVNPSPSSQDSCPSCIGTVLNAGNWWSQVGDGKYGCRQNVPKDHPDYVPDDDKKNFMRHCGFSCETAAKAGEGCAHTAGLLNEISEGFDGFVEDMHNNAIGIGLGSGIPSGPNTRSECQKACQEQFDAGNYLGIGQVW